MGGVPTLLSTPTEEEGVRSRRLLIDQSLLHGQLQRDVYMLADADRLAHVETATAAPARRLC